MGRCADVPMCRCADVRMPARSKGAGADVKRSGKSVNPLNPGLNRRCRCANLPMCYHASLRFRFSRKSNPY
jgi:hypothetical protein